MFAPDLTVENALRFSRFDLEHPLSTSTRSILLEDQTWASPEHYVHAMLAGTPALAEQTRNAPTALAAFNLNKPWYRSKRRGWKKLRRVYMTRALYTLVQMYPEVCEYLLSTADELLVETTLYDHYWGIGRDQRGENMTGKVWMDLRKKLRDERDSGVVYNRGDSGSFAGDR